MSENTAAAVMAVKLPSAIQRQVDKTAQIEKELKERFAAKTPDGAQSVDTNAPVVKNDPAVSNSDPVVPVEDTSKDAKYWEHRFKTLQGMSEAEKTRLKSHASNLESRVSELENQLTKVKSQPNPTAIDLKRYLSDEEIDAYGPEVMKAAVKIARSVADEQSERVVKDELKRQIEPLKNQLATAEADMQKRSNDQFWDSLDRTYPKWLEINKNPKWLQWLGEVDPMSGIRRQDLLDHAQSNLDVNRVVAMFSHFDKSFPAQAPIVTPSNQVVPDPVASVQSNLNSDVPFVTRAEIKKYYQDKAIGVYRNRPQEADAMQKKIDAAIRAGNVK